MSRITKGATYRIMIATGAIVAVSVGMSFYYAHHRHQASSACAALVGACANRVADVPSRVERTPASLALRP
jgi:hypothetical protein